MYVGVNCKYMLRGQVVFPLDFDGSALLHFEGRTGILSFISPQLCRRKLGMQLLLEFLHANAILRRTLVRPVRL